MKFKCPECGDIISRDMRKIINQNNVTPSGYITACDKSGVTVCAKPAYETEKEWNKIMKKGWFIRVMRIMRFFEEKENETI